jgi:hypothetical protein
MNLAQLITHGSPVPKGFTKVAYIERHPEDESGLGYTVLASRRRIEYAWDGQSVRSLPKTWRDTVPWSPIIG